MELDQALAQIAEIRRHVARTETFRGYRSLTCAFSALVAFGAAAAQATWLPEPAGTPAAYVALWTTAAAICLGVTGIELAVHCRRARSCWATEVTWLAVEQFLPCVLAGGLVTLVIARRAPDELWMLPGLWAVLFSLGVFASRRLLPGPIIQVAVYYLVSGVLVLALGRSMAPLSPWAMAGTFGVGQSLTALVLYRTLERGDG